MRSRDKIVEYLQLSSNIGEVIKPGLDSGLDSGFWTGFRVVNMMFAPNIARHAG